MFTTLQAYISATCSPVLSRIVDMAAALLSETGASRQTAAILLTLAAIVLIVWVVSLTLDISTEASRQAAGFDLKLLFSLRFAILGAINTAALGGFLVGWSQGYGPSDTALATTYFREIASAGLFAAVLFTIHATALAGVFGLMFSLWQWLLSWFAAVLLIPCIAVALLYPSRSNARLAPESALLGASRLGRDSPARLAGRDRRW